MDLYSFYMRVQRKAGFLPCQLLRRLEQKQSPAYSHFPTSHPPTHTHLHHRTPHTPAWAATQPHCLPSLQTWRWLLPWCRGSEGAKWKQGPQSGAWSWLSSDPQWGRFWKRVSGRPASHPPWSANRKEDLVRQSTAHPPYRRPACPGCWLGFTGRLTRSGSTWSSSLGTRGSVSSTCEAVRSEAQPTPDSSSQGHVLGSPKSHGELSGEGQLMQEQKNQMILSVLTMGI